MKYQGINLENVKLSNRSAILRLLNSAGPMPRKDIAEAVGLTAASVTMICNELLQEGIIVELGEADEGKRAGRKKILVDINRKHRYVLCIGIETDETYLSIVDLKGEILCKSSFPTDKEVNGETFLGVVAEQCKKLLWEGGVSKNELLGAGVTVPGKVDREKGVSLNTYSIWNDEIRVAEFLREQLGMEIVVENNLKAYAESEILFGQARSEENVLLLKWGPGVGSAIIINQQVYQGANGMAAEIGHMSCNKNGKECNCGRRGCLETEISTHAIIRDLSMTYEFAPEDAPALTDWVEGGGEMTYRNTAEWAVLPDQKVQDIMTQKIDLLCHCLRNAVSFVDPAKVIVLGYMFEIPGIFDRFNQLYREYDPNVLEDFLTQSLLTERVNHTEALAIVLNDLFF